MLLQDPIYCDLDRDVLRAYDISVLDSPQGFLEVDGASVVLSFGPDIAVRQIIADIGCPAMMIWNQGRPMPHDIEDFRW